MKKFFVGAYRIRIIAIFAVLVVAAAFTTGCTETVHDYPRQYEVSLSADITASTLKLANNQFQSNDRIGLYMKAAGAALSVALESNVQMSLQGNLLVPTSSQQLLYPSAGGVDFIAYYPYQAVATGGELVIPVSLANQTSAVAQEILYSDNVRNQQPTDATVVLNFQYALAKVTITVEDPDLTSADYQSMSARIEGVYTQANKRLADGSFQYIGSKGNIQMRPTERTGAKAVFEALAIPMASGDVKMVFDYNGKTYQWSDNTDIEGGVHYIFKFENFSDDPVVERKQIKANASINPRGEQFVTIGSGNGTDPPTGDWLPRELLDSEQNILASFEYDNRNRMTKMVVLSGECTDISVEGGENESNCREYFALYEFIYVGDDLTQMVVSAPDENDVAGYTATFSRIGNIITNNYDSQKITVNAEGYPIRSEYSDGNVGINVNELEWTNGNLTKDTYKYIYNGTVFNEEVTTYIYNNSKSMFSNCRTPKWFMGSSFLNSFYSANNRIFRISPEGTVQYSYHISILSGLPVQIDLRSEDGTELFDTIHVRYHGDGVK